jgi:hypothetical protein
MELGLAAVVLLMVVVLAVVSPARRIVDRPAQAPGA